jgi:hypothetical protein
MKLTNPEVLKIIADAFWLEGRRAALREIAEYAAARPRGSMIALLFRLNEELAGSRTVSGTPDPQNQK